MVVGVVFLAVLATIMTLLVLGNRTPAADGSPSPSASGSGSAAPSSSAGSSPSSSAGPSATVIPSASAAAIALDTIVATAVDRLTLRAAPGTSAERLGSLGIGARTFVVDGPTPAEGYAWYLVSGMGLPPSAGCEEPIETDPFSCPYWFGWVAAAATDGTPWLIAAPGDCPPDAPTATQLILPTSLERLACYGSTPITFRAWWPEIPDDAGLGGACAGQGHASGWLLCQNINYDWVTIDESEGFGGVGVRISTDPASGISMPARGTWVEVRVHLDDPAAQGCDEAAAFGDDGRPAEQIVLDCRSELVLEAATAVDGP
jgi:hypothetical protein